MDYVCKVLFAACGGGEVTGGILFGDGLINYYSQIPCGLNSMKSVCLQAPTRWIGVLYMI